MVMISKSDYCHIRSIAAVVCYKQHYDYYYFMVW